LIGLGCPEDKVTVFHLGVDLNNIKFVPRVLGSKNDEIKILIAASFREKKGIPYAVEAVGRIMKSYPEINISLTIIGDSNGRKEGEMEKRKIFKVIDRYQMKEKTRLLGYQPHSAFISELYKNHIFLHPSVQALNGDTEGGAPVSTIEASASGMPVLSTFHCDIPGIIIDGKSGFLVKERDVSALQEKLKILLTNSDLWEKMGREGRSHIEKNFDVKKQAEKLEEIYDEVLMRKTEKKGL
ncbi:MAG: glycosyltransferase, partial [Minisyncoccia bacterium]